MKRVGNIFDEAIDLDNLRLAFWKASKGKRFRQDQISFQRNLDVELGRLRDGLVTGNYPIGDFRRFTIYDPKEREICAASFGERVLHHALMNVCERYFDKWLIYDSYACRKGKGQVAAVKRAQYFASRHLWFLKCDFRKYFDSIPHDRLKAALLRRFKDPFVLEWFFRIIDSYAKSPGRGLPIGSLTSQHFANFYLDPLDRRFGSPYVRYMDDFIFWANDKRGLLDLRSNLLCFVECELGLEFKQTPFVNKTRHGMDFLGMRIFPDCIRLSRASRVRYRRKMVGCEKALANGEIGELECQARMTSLTAFTMHADAKAWRRKILALCEEHRATTVSCAAAPGTTTRATAAPRIATGTGLATATGTTGSASFAPQHRRNSHAVPAEGRLPLHCGTNETRQSVVGSDVEDSALPPFENSIHKEYQCHR